MKPEIATTERAYTDALRTMGEQIEAGALTHETMRLVADAYEAYLLARTG